MECDIFSERGGKGGLGKAFGTIYDFEFCFNVTELTRESSVPLLKVVDVIKIVERFDPEVALFLSASVQVRSDVT
jgi:hypothetical protein